MSQTLADDEFPNQLSSVENQAVVQELKHRSNLWRSNYHEASIYIEEGLNNDKFENHPRKRARKIAVAAATAPAHHNDHRKPHHSLQQQTTPLLTFIQSPAEFNATDQNDATQDGLLKVQPPKGWGHQQHQTATSATNGLAGSSSGGASDGHYTTIETYILVHNRYFYQLDLAASIVLLLLALIEPPAVDGYELNPAIHAAIEVFALGIIAIELLLKFRWMGPRRFFRHSRTVTKLIVLLTMNVEAIVIFLRHSIHARYSRALRPIFLIDNHYCHGLRRVIRQIFQSLPPILDMFTLVLFFMFVFSIFGFYLFAANNYYFQDMPATIGNLLILATTANLPDIMMPSYAISRWSAIFFVLFVIIHLFLFTNLTMAAVYEIFTRKEKEKFHKLLLHRRKACQEAFKLLVSRRQPNRVHYRQFMGLMRYLNRKCSMFDAYLIFKALDTDKNGSISLEEFYQIYDFINLEWKLIHPDLKWYDTDECACLPLWARRVLDLIGRIVRHRSLEWTINLLIASQAFLQFAEANTFKLPPLLKMMNPGSSVDVSQLATQNATLNSTGSSLQQLTPAANFTTTVGASDGESQPITDLRPDSVSTYVFVSIFLVEAILRCLADGWSEYWRNKWNRFDLIVLLISLCGLINGYAWAGRPFGWVIVLRTLRLMRLFQFKRRYKDMWQTITYILAKRFLGMTCVVMILYYFFAIVGMELLGDYDLRNCCQNTSLEGQFKFDNSTEGAKYYLNDFGDIIASYLTLFSMSSNTFWLATMSAYAIVSQNDWTRLFFGVYYLCSIVVMNIVIAFILESFLFHINYRNRMGDNCDDTNLFTVSVTLSSFEVDFLRENLGSQSGMRQLDRVVRKLQSSYADGHGDPPAQQQTSGGKLSPSSTHQNDCNTSSASSNTGNHRYDYESAANGKANDDDERTSLLGKTTAATSSNRKRAVNSAAGMTTTTTTPVTAMATPKQRQQVPASNSKRRQQRDWSPSRGDDQQADGRPCTCGHPQHQHQHQGRRPNWYLIYQAEQIRNKFSFTMKMYADEVEAWLAEAERADQDEMSLMISRNQIRAENVAMARLARRNLASEMNLETAPQLIDWTRPRSWSTSLTEPVANQLKKAKQNK